MKVLGHNLKKKSFLEASRACELAGEYEWVDWLEDEAAKVGYELDDLPNSLVGGDMY
ncbi:unnamed protein product [Prorocentrum cordatum]|uniref:Uncharacterized protein n=1 Tax=Prorocentrum cordatum TaxID=2364126 RepID=A0ABN9QSG1_9DINO|nr:unnamed protein product [Polarella glacialis]